MSGHPTRDASSSTGFCGLSAAGLRPEPRRNLKGFHFFGSVFILCSSVIWRENQRLFIALTLQRSGPSPKGGRRVLANMAVASLRPPPLLPVIVTDLSLSLSAPRSVAAVLRRDVEASASARRSAGWQRSSTCRSPDSTRTCARTAAPESRRPAAASLQVSARALQLRYKGYRRAPLCRVFP